MSLPNELLPLGLLGIGAAAAEGYAIERSVRFNSSDSAYLSRTPASAGNRKTWTWAGWVKRTSSSPTGAQGLLTANGSGDSGLLSFRYQSDGLRLASSTVVLFATTPVFRDFSAWYHIVLQLDTTQATASDRVKLYINGSQITTFDSTSYPSQNADLGVNAASVLHTIGLEQISSGYLNAYLADIYFIDGQALDPTSFGEFDADTGIWQPIDYTGGYGPLVNQAEVWSNQLSGGGLKTVTAGFDANPYVGRTEGTGGFSFTPSTPIVFTDKVEVYDNNNVSKSRINSGTYVQHATNAWVTVASGGGTVTTMNFLRTDNPAYDAGFYAIRIDGELLVDSGVAVTLNGFHLPFSNNSTAAALGTDSAGSNDWTVNNLFTRSVKTLPAVAFDGSGDYLSLADSDDWNLGSGDFTIEAYVYGNSFGSYEGIVGQFPQAEGNTANSFVLEAVGGDLEFFYSVGSTLYGPIQGATLTPKKWHHVAAVRSGNTMYMFVDGVMYGSGSSVTHTFNDAASPLTVGGNIAAGGFWNGFISNVRVIKGTALYTSNFTPPSAPITVVANTKLLCCQSSTSATAATVSPGTITVNGNAFATTRSDSSASEDSLVDVPVNGTETDTGVGGEVRGNYCTWNPLGGFTKPTLSNGNLDYSNSGTARDENLLGTFAFPSSGKWYFEFTPTAFNSSLGSCRVGIARNGKVDNANTIVYNATGNFETFDVADSTPNSYTQGDVIGVAVDVDATTIYFYKNNTLEGSKTFSASDQFFPFTRVFQNSGSTTRVTNFGQRPFAYTAPSGFKALCTANLPAPVITKPSTVMDVALYTGNGSTQNITGLGFNPDLVWMKVRNYIYWNELVDSVRGVGKSLFSNAADAEGTINTLTAFNADGFTVSTNSGTYNGTNENGRPYVAWTWDAGSSTVSNTDGSISSQVRANATAGFSVVTWTSNGASSIETVGHSLGVTPALIIAKGRGPGTTSNWHVWSNTFSNQVRDYLYLNTTAAKTTAGVDIWSTSSSTFGIRQSSIAVNNDGCVAYCFAPVAGYSAFGSYVGNGSSDGVFVYTGFRPRWILVKSTGATGWAIIDAARDAYNLSTKQLFPHASDAELDNSTQYLVADLLSNGFKLRTTSSASNTSSQSYVFAAFAESPFQYSRAR